MRVSHRCRPLNSPAGTSFGNDVANDSVSERGGCDTRITTPSPSHGPLPFSFEQHAEQDLYDFIIQFDRGFYIHCPHIRLWTMHVKALVQFDDMIIQPNPNSYSNLYPNRIVMVQDARHKKG
jgi:hypothetical protein